MRSFIFLMTAIVAVSAMPVENDIRYKALYNPDLFEGDMVGIDPEDRNAVPWTHWRWPNGIVPYVIDHTLDNVTTNILNAMVDYHLHTCIRFRRRQNEKNYILLTRGKGCDSMVGMTGRGVQLVNLGEGCHDVGTIVHELGHAIGLYHEQSRSDRDKYLTIHWGNIHPNMTHNFKALKPHENLIFVPFDYNSIMHYGNYAFTQDWNKMTMEAKDGTPLKEPFNKPGLAKSDITRVNKLYMCRGY